MIEALGLTSLAILCCFAMELILLIVALDWRFFTNVFYVMDTAVVAIALWAQAEGYRDHNTSLYAVPLLVILRVWRFGVIFFDISVRNGDAGRRVAELEDLVERQKARLLSLERTGRPERRRSQEAAVLIHDQRTKEEMFDDESAPLAR